MLIFPKNCTDSCIHLTFYATAEVHNVTWSWTSTLRLSWEVGAAAERTHSITTVREPSLLTRDHGARLPNLSIYCMEMDHLKHEECSRGEYHFYVSNFVMFGGFVMDLSLSLTVSLSLSLSLSWTIDQSINQPINQIIIVDLDRVTREGALECKLLVGNTRVALDGVTHKFANGQVSLC